jgi:hypothetical protein
LSAAQIPAASWIVRHLHRDLLVFQVRHRCPVESFSYLDVIRRTFEIRGAARHPIT